MARKTHKVAKDELDPAILALVRALAIVFARADHEAETACNKNNGPGIAEPTR